MILLLEALIGNHDNCSFDIASVGLVQVLKSPLTFLNCEKNSRPVKFWNLL